MFQRGRQTTEAVQKLQPYPLGAWCIWGIMRGVCVAAGNALRQGVTQILGGVAERLNAPVLKTGNDASRS